MDNINYQLLIKDISLGDGSLIINVSSMPLFDQSISWIENLCHLAGITLKSTDYGADLVQAQIFFEQEDFMLSLNFITNDVWIMALSDGKQAGLHKLHMRLRLHFATN